MTVLNKFYVGKDRERHALLVPITRLSVHIVMFLCGYTVRVQSGCAPCSTLRLMLDFLRRLSSAELRTWTMHGARRPPPTRRLRSWAIT